MRVIIFRKVTEGTEYPKKVAKDARQGAVDYIVSKSRVKRPELLSFLLPTTQGRSKFARLAPITRSELHHLADCVREGVMTPDAKSTLAKGWVLPESELGRMPKSGERDFDSTAQSVLLYAKDRVGAVTADHGFHSVSPYGDDISVIATE